MFRAIIILLAIAVVLIIASRIWKAIVQLKLGAIPDDSEVPDLPMSQEKVWQLTRKTKGGVSTIKVEHPEEGVARQWQVQLREPKAVHRLDEVMSRAGSLVNDLRS